MSATCDGSGWCECEACGPLVEPVGHAAVPIMRAGSSSWRVSCPTCGEFGGPGLSLDDAAGIAARHFERGGFER